MNTQTELGTSLQREKILSQRLIYCLDNGLDLDMVEDDQLWKTSQQMDGITSRRDIQ